MIVTIHRNPHTANHKLANHLWVARWAEVIVSYNGRLLHPNEFIEAKGSNAGAKVDGYVDFITHPLDLDTYRVNKRTVALPFNHKEGKVVIHEYSANGCGGCLTKMKSDKWWDYKLSIMGKSRPIATYTNLELASFDRRAQEVFKQFNEHNNIK